MAITATIRIALARRVAFVPAFGAALLAAACAPVSSGNLGPGGSGGPTRVTGFLIVESGPARGSQTGHDIEIPDARVFLADRAGNRAGEAVTQLDGRFVIQVPQPGRYRLCYEAGGLQACARRVTAQGGTLRLDRVVVAAEDFIHGRSLTADDRPCWVADSFFGLDVSTRVTAVAVAGSRAAQASARANTEGEYVLFGLRPGRYALTSTCEAAQAVGTADIAGGVTALDLPLPNRAPILRSAAALAGTEGIVQSVPGRALALRAETVDPDGDNVQYMWRTLDGGGAIQNANAAAANWRLPAAEGLQSVYLMARDGRGGFAYRRIDIESVRSNRVSAVGQAVDEVSGAPIADATVTFGSATGRTGADGWFRVESEPRDDDRYVLNIRRGDYSLVSRVYDRSTRGDVFRLIPVQASQLRAGTEIRLLDRTSGSMCGAPSARRERAPVRRSVLTVLDPESGRPVKTGTSSEPPAAAEPDCLARGAAVTVPAQALVDSGNRRAVGPITAAMATIDPSRRPLPGDYSAVGRDGRPAALQSFGAVDIRFTDSRGRALNLRPGAKAEIRMPVPEGAEATAPETIDMWSYDEATARWIPEGRARLERSAAGSFYVGETRHFSIINMDIEYNRANATCVRVELDQTLASWNPRTLRAYVTFGGGTSSQMKEVQLDNDQYHGIFLLPYTAGSTLRLELRGMSGTLEHVMLSDFILFGPPTPQMTGPALIPNYPYSECGPAILLSAGPNLMPYYGIDGTLRPVFLTGPFGALNPTTPQGANYYAAIAGAAKATLGDWWQANGFSNTGQGTNSTFALASYMNHNDLGFGRRMHCQKPNATDLACYVTNYGLPDQNSQNANSADAQLVNQRGATVAMEYDQSAGADFEVRFYVYNGGVSASPRIEFADLDGLGPKPVPHLCMVCHGGDYATAGSNPNQVKFARFREFDLPSFRYLNGQTWNYPITNPPPLLDPLAFARLNEMVADVHPGTPINELIHDWYPSGFAGGPLPQLPAPPAGWASNAAAYHDVYGQSCRTCHIAQDRNDAANEPVFITDQDMLSSPFYVCGVPSPKTRRMPNAFITYRNFWSDLFRVADYETLAGTSNCGSP